MLPEASLIETLENLASSTVIGDGEIASLVLQLPATGAGPLPSPELILDEARATQEIAEATFSAWIVTSLSLNAGSALDFLLRLPAMAPRGVAYGSSLRFWIEVARFAFELITRQCFVPALHSRIDKGKTTYSAAWDAYIAPEDSTRVALLARVMPPVCWSYVQDTRVTEDFPRECVLQFLNQTIDAYIRQKLVTISIAVSASRQQIVAKTAMSTAEKWLTALRVEDGIVRGSAQELEPFAADLHSWLGQLQPVDQGSPFRTCFRLEEPEELAGETTKQYAWHVNFYLQANDDPSLLVPANVVWRERSSTLTFLKRRFENPQERLLADLGKASRLVPDLEAGLRAARPSDLALTSERAYAFLRESVPLLEQSGFGVLVPPWWQKAAARVGVKLRVKPAVGDAVRAGLMGLNSIIEYNWSIAIGENTLSANEFEDLVRLKQPLVNIRGQWVELRPEEIEAAIKFFKKKQAMREMSLGEALRIGLGEGVSEIGLPVVGMEAEGWIKEALDRLTRHAELDMIDVPATFNGVLRPYQVKGVSWLAFLKQFGFGACLADDMGLGKTACLIAAILYGQAASGNVTATPSLVICPMSIVGNWQRELQRFAPSLAVMVHHGAERLSGDAFAEEARKHDVVITTYSLALRDKEHLSAITWHHVVIDEAQNIKNDSAKQTQAIKQLPGTHRIALTGTPVENRLSELWSIMEFLNPGYLGSGSDFRQRFAIPIERYRNAERGETLKKMIQPFVLRRLKTDRAIIDDLPDKMEMKVYCNLTQEQASLYEAVVKEMLEKIEESDGITRRGLVLATLTKLKQVCNHPAHFMGDGSALGRRSGKLARLQEMLEEVLAEGDKALIFTQFAEMGTLLRQYLQEQLACEVMFLHGGVSKKQRDIMVQRFQQERRGAPLFILSLKAGGVGLNLTEANHVFHFDRWWNPAVENQATDRAFRIGQKKNVQVHKFISVGTLEERIDQMIEQKKELAESIVGSGENWLTEMSTDQLKELFTLNREAVGE
jgi:SNF2 family DNA or RNA helicase